MNRQRAKAALLALEENPKGWRYDQVSDMLEGFGFDSPRKPSGSHRVHKHRASGGRVVLVDAGSGTLKPVYVQEAAAAIRRVIAWEAQEGEPT